jgi:hypothetical protein
MAISIPPSGLLTSWATPAATRPTAARRSAWIICRSKRFLLGERREHGRELPPETTDLAVAVGQGALHAPRILPTDTPHALGQLHQRPDHASPPEPADRQQDNQDPAGHQDTAEEDLAKSGQIRRVREQRDELPDTGPVAGERQAQQTADILAIDREHAPGLLVDRLRRRLRKPRQDLVQGLIQTESARAIARKDPTGLVDQDPDRIAAAVRAAQQRVGQPDIVVAQGLDLYTGHRVPEAQRVASLVLAQVRQGLQPEGGGHRQGRRDRRDAQAQGQAQAIARQGQAHAPRSAADSPTGCSVNCPAMRAISS